MTHERTTESGYALLTVLMLLALVTALLLAYFTLTTVDMATTDSSLSSISGFYAAEGGLNIRAEVVEAIFEDYAIPNGAGPASGGGQIPCTTGNMGSSDYACVDYALHQRTVTTYVQELAGNPNLVVIPRGERYQNLQAQEYRYNLGSIASNAVSRTEASLEMRMKTRLVPLFQFIAFYNKDLEILPGPTMTLSGPIHTNGDLYLDPDNSLDISGQVTASGEIYRGMKSVNTCQANPVRVLDPTVLSQLPNCGGGARMAYIQTDLDPWNEMVQIGVDVVDVPPPEALDPTPGELYWDRADIRIVLDLNGAPAIEIRDANGNVDGAGSAVLGACAAVVRTNTMYDNREGAFIEMLDVDMLGLIDCVHANNALMGGKALDDATDTGLVWYFGVDGPNSAGLNNYGVRISNGAELDATAVGAPDIQGLTVVSNQAMYVQGDFNSIAKKPAAFLTDTLNVLSNNWSDANSALPLANRPATDTTINAAFLAGTDSTGGAEGAGGQDGGGYNGGLENYPRFHESWSGRTLTYRGSFVSLNTPVHSDGAWAYGDPIYQAPVRDWDYDTDFNNAANLPPLTPRFTYVRQELVVRRFEP